MQINFMRDFENQDGISFLIIMFTHKNQFYYMRFSELAEYLDRVDEGHPKYFSYDELDPEYFIKGEAGALVHYLKALQQDLNSRK